MLLRRKARKKDVDEDLLDSIFTIEAEWKHMQKVIDKSYSLDVAGENKQIFKLKQAVYMFLLREAKERNLSALRY